VTLLDFGAQPRKDTHDEHETEGHGGKHDDGRYSSRRHEGYRSDCFEPEGRDDEGGRRVHETQVKVKEGMEKAMRTAEDLVSFGQGNLEAMLKSSQIWAAGVQDLSKQMAASAQASFDETMSTFKAMATVKSLKDAMDLQATLARATMEKTLAESGKLTDASFKLTEQAIAPITARVSLAVEKFAKSA